MSKPMSLVRILLIAIPLTTACTGPGSGGSPRDWGGEYLCGPVADCETGDRVTLAPASDGRAMRLVFAPEFSMGGFPLTSSSPIISLVPIACSGFPAEVDFAEAYTAESGAPGVRGRDTLSCNARIEQRALDGSVLYDSGERTLEVSVEVSLSRAQELLSPQGVLRRLVSISTRWVLPADLMDEVAAGSGVARVDLVDSYSNDSGDASYGGDSYQYIQMSDDHCLQQAEHARAIVEALGTGSDCGGNPIPADRDEYLRELYGSCVLWNTHASRNGCPDVREMVLACQDAVDSCTPPPDLCPELQLQQARCMCPDPPTEEVRQWCEMDCGGLGC